MTDTANAEQFSWGKWFLLGAIAMALCSLLPFSVFAAVPLGFAVLLYGKSMTLLLGVLCLGFLITLALTGGLPPVVAVLFFVAYVVATVTTEIIIKKLHPGKGLIGAGTALVLVTVGLFGILVVSTDVPIKATVEQEVISSFEKIKAENKELFKKGGEEARGIEQMMSDPAKLAQDIINWAPAGLFVSTVLTLWVTLFMLLRNSLIWRRKIDYPFALRDLVKFRTPEYFVYPLILALALAVGGEYVLGPIGTVIGGSLLYCVGVFYFFQGTGLFADLLSYMRIFGLFRSFMLVFTVFMAWRVLFVFGMLDNWVNFRRFLKNNHKGDM